METTEKLAELCGIIAGDGCITYYKKNGDYRVQIFGDYKEIEYHNYIKTLFQNIFNKTPKTIYKDDGISIYLNSKDIITKLIKLGLPAGKKKDIIRIPKWIITNKRFSAYFLRGLTDTDGSITFKKGDRKTHSYPTIKIELSSKKFIEDIKSVLKNFGISYCYYSGMKKSNFGVFRRYSLDINGKENLKKWRNLIGFSNRKHLNKIEFWDKYGYCLPYQSFLKTKSLINKVNLKF